MVMRHSGRGAHRRSIEVAARSRQELKVVLLKLRILDQKEHENEEVLWENGLGRRCDGMAAHWKIVAVVRWLCSWCQG
jgi:hypothetical protein